MAGSTHVYGICHHSLTSIEYILDFEFEKKIDKGLTTDIMGLFF
jgi:hypothetical protein